MESRILLCFVLKQQHTPVASPLNPWKGFFKVKQKQEKIRNFHWCRCVFDLPKGMASGQEPRQTGRGDQGIPRSSGCLCCKLKNALSWFSILPLLLFFVVSRRVCWSFRFLRNNGKDRRKNREKGKKENGRTEKKKRKKKNYSKTIGKARWFSFASSIHKLSGTQWFTRKVVVWFA